MTGFNEFWAEYPRKVGRADAEIYFADALKGNLRRQRKLGRGPATEEQIMAGLARYKIDKPEWCDWLHGSTFLSTLRWEDEGGAEVIEHERDEAGALEFKRREHERGDLGYPTLARQHGWAEFGSCPPKLRVVK